MKEKNKYIKRSFFYIKRYQIARILMKLFFGAVFIFIAIFIIAFARGFRIDFENQRVSSTGILTISSAPRTAKVYINGVFKGVTDLNINLPPGKYKVEVQKEGYIPYVQELTLKGEIVETIDPLLFPINPSLSPITNLGITRAFSLIPFSKILLISDTGESDQDGIYIYEAGKKTLNFFPPLKTVALKRQLPASINLADATVSVSHDYKQAIIEFKQGQQTLAAYLISLDGDNKELFDVTFSKDTLLQAWKKGKDESEVKILETYPRAIRDIALAYFEDLEYSPDESKLLYRANSTVAIPLALNPPLIASSQTPETRILKKDHIYVYDRREDKNYEVANSADDLDKISWYNNSKHLVYRGGDIAISEYDGSSKEVVYSGPFDAQYLSLNSDGQLLILANLNPSKNKLPDLYMIGIK